MPPNTPYGQQPAVQPDYSFLTQTPAKSRRSLPGGGSLLSRVVLATVALIACLLIFSIVRSLLSPPSPLLNVVTVAQDQAEILHLVGNAAQQQNLSMLTTNFDQTAQLVFNTAQSQTLAYLKNNGKKVSTTQLNLKINAQLDNQLTTAATNSDYDQVYQAAMKNELATYQNDLRTAYPKLTGAKGRALLTQNFNNATLLLQQLNSQ